jgi:hypothetical protein
MTRIKLFIFSLLCIASLSLSAQTNSDTQRPLSFAWGANLNGGVELSSHDMSTLGINGEFGLRYRWIRFLGASAEADITIGNSARVYPLSVVFRTDFSNTQKLLFLDLRGGAALLYHEDDSQETQPYASAGLGVTLAHGKTFASHLIIGYTYIGQDECMRGERRLSCPGMSYASVRLGLAF